MHLECQHCGHKLEFSGSRPSFCGYCGKPLAPARESVTTDDEVTQLYTAERTDDAVADATTLAGSSPLHFAGEAPEQVGNYRLLRRLGGGGMGAVYEAVHEASGQRVAVKLILADVGASPENIERFRQEGRLASTLAHPRCVFVLSVDEEAGRPYIVMELMPGRTLEDLVKERGPLPIAEALRLGLDVLEGLQEAHHLGVIHRDVKPSNCFLDADGRVKVGDFGLAKSLVGDTNLTRTGTFLGTPLFASPEQVKREPVDPQSDVYSLAATLYYLLAGKAPFQTGDPVATLARIVSDDAPPLRSLRPDVPAGLERVILRGLERDRKRRWRDTEEFRAALLPFVPRTLSVGGLGARFAAYVLDSLALLVVWTLVVLPFSNLPESNADLDSLTLFLEVPRALLFIAYFTVGDGLLGFTLGKWLLRLRVCRVVSGAPPGLSHALLRSLVFYALVHMNSWLPLAWLVLSGSLDALRAQEQSPELLLGVSGFSLLGLVLGCGPLLLTMRRRNGYRGLHEFASGTRVIELPWPRRLHSYERSPSRIEMLGPADLPESIGPYRVQGALRWQEDEKTLLADDPFLGRSVWVWLRPAGAAPLERARREVNRSTRLRWLGCGAQAEWQWDAFLAPAGSSLPSLVDRRDPMPWSEFRPVLEQLAEELDVSCREGTLPRSLSPDQVWLDKHGRLVLLGTPLTATATGTLRGQAVPHATHQSAERDEARALAFLREVAICALEGGPRPDGNGGPVAAPLPGPARAMLGRLLAAAEPYENLAQLREDLRASADQPTEVTRWQRLQHLALQFLFLGIGLGSMFLPALLVPSGVAVTLVVNLAREKTALEHSDEGLYTEFVIGSLTEPGLYGPLPALAYLDDHLRTRAVLREAIADAKAQEVLLENSAGPMPRLWLKQLRQQKPAARKTPHEPVQYSPLAVNRRFPATAQRALATRERIREFGEGPTGVFSALVVLVLTWPAVWVGWAFLTRGGLGLRFAGLALVRRVGRPAARWQCAWRAFLIWAPVALSVLLALWWEWGYYAKVLTLPAGSAAPVYWHVLLVQFLSVLLLPAYALTALWRPERGVQDRLAGTYLVPR
jgi:hypothetical protein